MIQKIRGELVTCRSTTGTQLDGILYECPNKDTIVVHVHGSYGNFYQNGFIRSMAKAYHEVNISFLSINMTNHDGVAEGYGTNNSFRYVGGAIADFSECVSDIQGVIEYAKCYGSRVILQGHSLGCDRVLHFLISTQEQYEFILISPCDSYKLHAIWIAPETIDHQVERLKKGKSHDSEFDWLSSREYGVKGDGDWIYPIPVTRRALLSIIEGPAFQIINLAKPATFDLRQRAFMFIGGQDALQVWPKENMLVYFGSRCSQMTSYFNERGDHNMEGCEKETIERILEWIRG